jgi:hypothetical protein
MKPGLAGLTAMRCIVLLNITESVACAVETIGRYRDRGIVN